MNDEWEIRDLFDGRFGIFKNGLCKVVVKSREEADDWFHKHNSSGISISNSLETAIRKLR